MDDAALVGEGAVGAHQHVVGHGLPEDLHFEHVWDDFLRLAVQIGVDQRHVVVARDHVAQGAEALLDSLDADGVGQGVPHLLQLLVGGRAGHQESVSVSHGHPPDDPASRHRGVDHGDHLVQLGLEGGVEILWSPDGDQAVGVGQLGEDPDLIVVFEMGADHGHSKTWEDGTFQMD